MSNLELYQQSFEQLTADNPFYEGAVCDPKQWQEITQHEMRVYELMWSLATSDKAVSIFPNGLIGDNWSTQEYSLAALHHDHGYALIPNHIHLAIKAPDGLKEYDDHFLTHPYLGLDLLGERFVKNHQLASALILRHNLNTPQHPHRFIDNHYVDFAYEDFSFGLVILVVADSIAAANELDRPYNLNGASPQERTIKILSEKLKRHHLDHWINVAEAVPVGYEAFNQLGF